MDTWILLASAALGGAIALRYGIRLLAVACAVNLVVWLLAWAAGAAALPNALLGAIVLAATCQVGFFVSVVAQAVVEGRVKRHSRVASPR